MDSEKRRDDKVRFFGDVVVKEIGEISWTEKKTDLAVLEMVGEKGHLVDMIVQRKNDWIGHVMRLDGLLRDIIKGRLEGRRPKGRARMGMLKELMEDSF